MPLMAVQFMLGRAGAGKTRACLDAIRTALADERDETPLVLLVPEQASFQMERALATSLPCGGYWRAEVLSFSRLARRVFDATGGEPETISARGRRLGLRCVATRRPEALRAFGLAGRTAGFFAQLERVIEELIVEGVSAAALKERAAALRDLPAQRRVAALADLYEGYDEWLGDGRIDAGRRLEALRARLAETTWLRRARVWVDGFAGFTGQECETLVALARVVDELVITLLVDPRDLPKRSATGAAQRLRLFSRTEQTLAHLTRRLEEAGETIAAPRLLEPTPPPRFRAALQLARLEAALADEHAAPEGDASVPVEANDASVDASSVAILECRSHRDELRRAAHFIRRKVIESDGALRFRDFAVIARDLEPFAPLVAEVFAEYELPYFLDRRRPLGPHALCRLIAAIHDVVSHDFSGAAARRLLRTGLLPLSRAQSDALENFIVEQGVHGRRAWRGEDWSRAGLGHAGLDAARRALVDSLEPLFELARADAPANGAQWAQALYEALTALQTQVRLHEWIEAAQRAQRHESAETHRLAWDALCELLDDVHEALAETQLRVGEFFDLVRSSLSETSLGMTPPTLDQVLVGSIERSRHPDIRYAWIMAFNEGVFPAMPAEDALLSTDERSALAAAGLPAPRSHRDDAFDERMLAYIALTRPSDGLVISYATSDGQGGERQPSPLLAWVRAALPEVDVRRPSDGAPLVCVSECVRGYLATWSARSATSAVRERYAQLLTRLRGDAQILPRLDAALRGLEYSNDAQTTPGYRDRYESDANVIWAGSPSEMETYLQCPFKHFVRYGLRIRERPGPRPLHQELGEVAHALLAGVFERAIADGRPVAKIADEDWLGWLRAATEAPATERRSELAECRPDVAFLRSVLFARLGELLPAHAERYRRGRFEPLAVERTFGYDDPRWPALELKAADGRVVRMTGKIDRIDAVGAGERRRLVIYDFKSTVGSFNKSYLTGDRLQLFLYAHAAADALGSPVEGALLAPLFAPPSNPGSQKWKEADEVSQRLLLFLPRGMFVESLLDVFDANVPADGSAVVQAKRKKEGFYAWSDTCGQHEFAQQIALASETVHFGAARIAEGAVTVAPLVEKRTLACRNCAFLDICRYEPALNDARPAERALPTIDGTAIVGADPTDGARGAR